MTFANPWPALIAGAIALPLLLLLYILKLRRRPMRVPSTLLWVRSFEDLQVNVPFQRLRTSLLFLLQLLAVLALLLALSEPRIEVGSRPAPRIILLIDRSASMNAVTDENETRLDRAKVAAKDIVERVGRSSEASQMMIITFGRTAQVVTSFEANRQRLLQAIDTIDATDEEADLDAALQLAGAFAARGEDAADQPPDVVLISDGGVSRFDQQEGFSLRSGAFRYVQVGPDDPAAVRNVGIAAFSARRDYEDPAVVLVFARLVNAGPDPANVVATLTVDGGEPTPKRAEIPAATEESPGEATVTFTIDLQRGALLELGHNFEDDLPADDVARLVIPPPARPRIALVYGDDGLDPFLVDLIDAMEPQRVEQVPFEQYEQMTDEPLEAGAAHDLFVFDRVSGHRLPAVASLTIGGLPAGIEETDPENDEPSRLLSWDRQHPLMRFVSLDTVVFRDFSGLVLPVGATSLAFGRGGPVIALVRTRGARHVVVGFALTKSNWPVHVSVTVFMQNVLDYLTLAGSVQGGITHQPGTPVSVRTRPGATELVVTGPLEAAVPASRGAAVTLPALRRAGLYRIEGAAEPSDRLAVSVLSEQESDIRPRQTVTVNATATGAANVAQTVPLELWPWLVGLGFTLLVAEWLLYCRRLRSMS